MYYASFFVESRFGQRTDWYFWSRRRYRRRGATSAIAQPPPPRGTIEVVHYPKNMC